MLVYHSIDVTVKKDRWEKISGSGSRRLNFVTGTSNKAVLSPAGKAAATISVTDGLPATSSKRCLELFFNIFLRPSFLNYSFYWTAKRSWYEIYIRLARILFFQAKVVICNQYFCTFLEVKIHPFLFFILTKFAISRVGGTKSLTR